MTFQHNGRQRSATQSTTLRLDGCELRIRSCEGRALVEIALSTDVPGRTPACAELECATDTLVAWLGYAAALTAEDTEGALLFDAVDVYVARFLYEGTGLVLEFEDTGDPGYSFVGSIASAELAGFASKLRRRLAAS